MIKEPEKNGTAHVHEGIPKDVQAQLNSSNFNAQAQSVVEALWNRYEVKAFVPSIVDIQILHVASNLIVSNSRLAPVAEEVVGEIFGNYSAINRGSTLNQEAYAKYDRVSKDLIGSLDSRRRDDLTAQFKAELEDFSTPGVFTRVRDALHINRDNQVPLEIIVVDSIDGNIFSAQEGVVGAAEAVCIMPDEGVQMLYISTETYTAIQNGDLGALSNIDHEYMHTQRHWHWGTNGILGEFFDERAAIIAQRGGNISHFGIRVAAMMMESLTQGEGENTFSTAFLVAVKANTPETVIELLAKQFGDEYVLRLLLERIAGDFIETVIPSVKLLGVDTNERNLKLRESMIIGRLATNPDLLNQLLSVYLSEDGHESMHTMADLLFQHTMMYKVPGIGPLLGKMADNKTISEDEIYSANEELRTWATQ